jgi:hypothetical protein
MIQWRDYESFTQVHVDFGFYSEVTDPLADIINRALDAPSDEEAWEITMEGENLMVEYPNWIPIYYDNVYWLVNPKVEGLRSGLRWNWEELNKVTIAE